MQFSVSAPEVKVNMNKDRPQAVIKSAGPIFNYPAIFINFETPTSSSGCSLFYFGDDSLSTIVYGGEYRRSRGPNRNAYRRRIEYFRASFPIGTLGAKEVDSPPKSRCSA